MFSEQFLAPFLTLSSVSTARFGLSHRIEYHSLLVQPIHRIPVVSFPCTVRMLSWISGREAAITHLVNFVFVVFHKIMLTISQPEFQSWLQGDFINSGEFPEIRVEFPENWNFWLICGKSASYFCFRARFYFRRISRQRAFFRAKMPAVLIFAENKNAPKAKIGGRFSAN